MWISIYECSLINFPGFNREVRQDGTLVCHSLCMLHTRVRIQAKGIKFNSCLIFELKKNDYADESEELINLLVWIDSGCSGLRD